MINRIETSAAYAGEDGSVLGGACADLREELDILLESGAEEHKSYTLNNSSSSYGRVNDNATYIEVLPRRDSTSAPMKIHFEGGERIGQEVPVRGMLILGRSSTADIILQDEAISRRHLQFLDYGDRQIVRDMGSQNGTLINGERLGGSKLLVDGDVIQIGEVVMRVLEE